MATTKNTTTDYKQLWQHCLDMIREKYGEKYEHWFNTWFGDVRFESYNEKSNQLILQVPSKYVYEYLEMEGRKNMKWVLDANFPKDCKVGYRIAPQELTFAQIATYMQRQSTNANRDLRHIKIANAKQRLEDGLKYYLKEKPMQWIYGNHGYDRVVEWLTDNKGKGLLCIGTTGLGKSLICTKILPILIGNGRKIACINATELHDKLDELKKEPVVVIDDLGKEPRKHYGEADQSFFELCDNAEKTGAILIITTNLSTDLINDTYPDSILHRYGNETYSRVKAILRCAIFKGEDMRK